MLVAAMLLVAATGCMVGPDYEPPLPMAPDAWKSAVIDEVTDPNPGLESWWLAFEDAALIDLIDRAVAANRSLLLAIARIEESRALLGIASGQLPNLALDAAYSRHQVVERPEELTRAMIEGVRSTLMRTIAAAGGETWWAHSSSEYLAQQRSTAHV